MVLAVQDGRGSKNLILKTMGISKIIGRDCLYFDEKLIKIFIGMARNFCVCFNNFYE